MIRGDGLRKRLPQQGKSSRIARLAAPKNPRCPKRSRSLPPIIMSLAKWLWAPYSACSAVSRSFHTTAVWNTSPLTCRGHSPRRWHGWHWIPPIPRGRLGAEPRRRPRSNVGGRHRRSTAIDDVHYAAAGPVDLGAKHALVPQDRVAVFIKPLLERLSEEFGEAQYFCTHRDAKLHCWARARQGRLIRGYGWLGQKGLTLWDEGEPTKAESPLACGLRIVDPRSALSLLGLVCCVSRSVGALIR